MRKSRFILMSVAMVLLVLCMGAGILSATPTVEPGFEASATIEGEARFRNFNSIAGAEIWVGQPWGNTIPPTSNFGSRSNLIWAGSVTGTNKIIFSYDGTDLRARVEPTSGTARQATYNIGALGQMNYIHVRVKSSKGNTVSLSNVKVNDEVVPDTFKKTGKGIIDKMIKNVSLTGSFTIEGDLTLTGSFGGRDSAYVNLAVGYFLPDNEGPEVKNILISPDTQYLNGPVEVSATIDDTNKGGTDIESADYKLNDGPWTAMSAKDGSFDEVSEDVEDGFLATQIGLNTVCVKGKDLLGNESAPVCATFMVVYKFEGFFSPIENDAENSAKAGQAIPVKWVLTDYNNTPISDPASFEGLFSYGINCDTLAGDPSLAVDEVASGSSGLQYMGDGYWQFNWKTPKNYADSCRAMYVGFNSDTISQVVKFKFKK